jgi:MFS family permease
VAFAYSGNIYELLAIRFAHGAAAAAILPVAFAYVGEISPLHQEGRIMGLFQIALMGGLSAGPFLGGVVNDILGLRMAFWSMGIFSFFAFCLCLALLPSERHRVDRRRQEREIPYGRLLKDPAIASLFMYYMCLLSTIGIIWSFVPLLAVELGLTSSHIGIILMLNQAFGALCMYPMGLAADRFDKRIPMGLAGFVAAGAVLCFRYAQNFRELLIAGGMHGVAVGIANPGAMAVAVICGRRHKAMGATMGLISLSHSLGMVIGPILGGLIIDIVSFHSTFLFGAVLLALGTLFILFLIPSAVARPAAVHLPTSLLAVSPDSPERPNPLPEKSRGLGQNVAID